MGSGARVAYITAKAKKKSKSKSIAIAYIGYCHIFTDVLCERVAHRRGTPELDRGFPTRLVAVAALSIFRFAIFLKYH